MRDVVVEQWAREPAITVEIRRSLAELNRGFLDLGGFAAPRLAALPAAQKAAVAACPYALFDLRFHDDAYWRARLDGGRPWRGVAETGAFDAEVVSFVRTALFYAWHLASSASLRARLLLGMHERTAEAFAAASVGGLGTLAAAEAGTLTTRWCDCERFWRALADAAERADRARLRRVQLYGLQLAAASRLR